MNWHDDGPESGPSADDIAEALRLRNLHRKSPTQETCLWCRFAWPCQHHCWSEEIMSAAGDGLEDPTAAPARADTPNPANVAFRVVHPAGRRPITTVPLPRGSGPDGGVTDPERDT